MMLKKLAIFSMILGFGISVMACDAEDDNEDKKTQENAENGQNSEAGGNKQDVVSNEDVKCDENCPKEAQCIQGRCVLDNSAGGSNDKTEKCGDAVCADGDICIDNKCVKPEVPQPGACDAPCPEGYICNGGPQCVKVEKPEPTGCETTCPEGYICNGTQCIIEASDCNVNPCDPSGVCVNSHYCLEVCADNAAKVISSIERLMDEIAWGGDEQAKAGFQVVKTQEELSALTASLSESSSLKIPAYTPDFSKNWLLVVTSGEKSNTGYTLRLNSACVLGDKTTVTMHVDNCDTDAAGDALQWLWHIYEVPAQGEYDVEFIEQHNVGCVGI